MINVTLQIQNVSGPQLIITVFFVLFNGVANNFFIYGQLWLYGPRVGNWTISAVLSSNKSLLLILT